MILKRIDGFKKKDLPEIERTEQPSLSGRIELKHS